MPAFAPAESDVGDTLDVGAVVLAARGVEAVREVDVMLER